ncbi:MAG: ATP-binding protein [Planctomycetota bacterium]
MKTPDRPVDLTIDVKSPSDRLLQRRAELAAAVATACEHLLRSSSWTAGVDRVLQLLGEATDSCRVHVLELRRGAAGERLAYRCASSARNGVQPRDDDTAEQPLDLVANGCQHWFARLELGLALEIDELRSPEGEREVLRSRGECSLLALPVFVGGQLFGMLMFAGVARPRVFDQTEIDALRPLTAVLSAAIERQELAARLQRMQRTEALGRMAGAVAHDFNNLLTVLSGAFETVSQGSSSNERATRESAALATTVQQAIEQGAGLLRRLMHYGRMRETAPRDLDLALHVRGAADLLRQALGRATRLVIAAEQDAPSVCIDSLQLDQVLLNLALNARDAMPTGGTFTIEIASATIDSAGRAGTFTTLRVRDDGCGMPPHVASRIFEPYFTTKDEDRGSGIGLTTVRAIVAAAGGTIAVRSAVGSGTEFCIQLPTTSSRALERSEARAAS